jgi:YHS domain-containing protein
MDPHAMKSVTHLVQALAGAAMLACAAPSAAVPVRVEPAQAPAGAPSAPARAVKAPSAAPDRAVPPNVMAALPLERTLSVDAVQLRRGSVVAGDRRWTIRYQGFDYLFSGPDTMELFAGDPAGYGAADAGACGRMGPLGGLGDARRYLIHENRLHFFASDDCMARFKASPASYLEKPETIPVGDPELQTAGLAAFDRWVGWSGGKDAVRSASRYRQRSLRRVGFAGSDWDLVEEWEIDGPQNARYRELRTRVPVPGATSPAGPAQSSMEVVLTPDAARLFLDGKQADELLGTRRQAFERNMRRIPWSILRARVRPEAGLLVIKSGDGVAGGRACDFVTTWFEGCRTNLAIDRATGELLQVGHSGRDESQRVSDVLLDMRAWAGPEAMRLPTQWGTFHGGATEGTLSPVASIELPGWSPRPAP